MVGDHAALGRAVRVLPIIHRHQEGAGRLGRADFQRERRGRQVGRTESAVGTAVWGNPAVVQGVAVRIGRGHEQGNRHTRDDGRGGRRDDAQARDHRVGVEVGNDLGAASGGGRVHHDGEGGGVLEHAIGIGHRDGHVAGAITLSRESGEGHLRAAVGVGQGRGRNCTVVTAQDVDLVAQAAGASRGPCHAHGRSLALVRVVRGALDDHRVALGNQERARRERVDHGGLVADRNGRGHLVHVDDDGGSRVLGDRHASRGTVVNLRGAVQGRGREDVVAANGQVADQCRVLGAAAHQGNNQRGGNSTRNGHGDLGDVAEGQFLPVHAHRSRARVLALGTARHAAEGDRAEHGRHPCHLITSHLDPP